MVINMEKKISISEAAKMLSLESHVLRYWELELNLKIQRNMQGHRFYESKDITLFRQIKQLKEMGFQLKAIKCLLPDLGSILEMPAAERNRIRDDLNQQVQEITTLPITGHTAQIMPFRQYSSNTNHNPAHRQPEYDSEAEEKLRLFENMMRNMIQDIMKEMQNESETRISEKITDKLLKEMDYLSRQKEENQEKQIALLEQILAQLSQGLPEAAASTENEVKPLRSRKRKFAKKSR